MKKISKDCANVNKMLTYYLAKYAIIMYHIREKEACRDVFLFRRKNDCLDAR